MLIIFSCLEFYPLVINVLAEQFHLLGAKRPIDTANLLWFSDQKPIEQLVYDIQVTKDSLKTVSMKEHGCLTFKFNGPKWGVSDRTCKAPWFAVCQAPNGIQSVNSITHFRIILLVFKQDEIY